MDVKEFIDELGVNFYTGVPDSQLKALCNYLIHTYGISKSHIIAANEGNATALAAGYHLATGEIPLVYLQNSGIGNIVNPVASLLNEKVYEIPSIFVVGWRGEKGVHDEPQHIFQGEITASLLENIGIHTYVISADTTFEEFHEAYLKLKKFLNLGQSIAFLIKKNGLTYQEKVIYENEHSLKREAIIENVVKVAEKDVIISTTGKASRELFEIREKNGQEHKYDFLTVGSMGHSSSIALEIALQKPDTKIWCIDGDGAVLMHMGAMAVIGANAPANFIHIVINNGAHETVGGMPTVAGTIDIVKIAKGCGYPFAVSVDNIKDLDRELNEAKKRNGLSLVEIKCGIGARADLGRPTTTPQENKKCFMEYLKTL